MLLDRVNMRVIYAIMKRKTEVAGDDDGRGERI